MLGYMCVWLQVQECFAVEAVSYVEVPARGQGKL